jgi:anthranilate synthase component I
MKLNINKQEFSAFLDKYSTVPVFESFILDTETPITLLYKFLTEKDFIFLESISEHTLEDRFSYFAFNPYKSISCTDTSFKINDEVFTEVNLYDFLQSIHDKYVLPKDCPFPSFSSGLIGSISYEGVQHLETVAVPNKRALNTPLAQFMIPRNLIVFDRVFNEIKIIHNSFREEVGKSVDEIYKEAIGTIQDIKTRLLAPLSAPIEHLKDALDPYESIQFKSNIDEETFKQNIKKAQEYIKSGDIFQIQVSRRAKMPFKGEPIMLYRHLRNYNPSPYLYYLKFDDSHFIGASPELLVDVEDRKMIIRPIAGTRKRYSKRKNEKEIIHELLNDEKEKAEHIMLVDLARNDVARACKMGTVKVNELMYIEKYTHVIHMVSDVVGELRSECTAIDALKYGFPAGTVTGAPKIRAMEIITELETEQREFYSGGVLFLDFKDNLKTALCIRTLLVKDGEVHTQAAAGIVADSTAEMECKEIMNKMRACLTAMVQYSGVNE